MPTRFPVSLSSSTRAPGALRRSSAPPISRSSTFPWMVSEVGGDSSAHDGPDQMKPNKATCVVFSEWVSVPVNSRRLEHYIGQMH